jgi:hypothetical protein
LELSICLRRLGAYKFLIQSGKKNEFIRIAPIRRSSKYFSPMNPRRQISEKCLIGKIYFQNSWLYDANNNLMNVSETINYSYKRGCV